MGKMTMLKRPKRYSCFNKSAKNLKGEEWRKVPFTEGYMQVSSFGRVKSLARIA
jgi:hypothetical protein